MFRVIFNSIFLFAVDRMLIRDSYNSFTTVAKTWLHCQHMCACTGMCAFFEVSVACAKLVS